MLKGYFHIIALGMTLCIVAQWHQSFFLFILFFLWMIYLRMYQQVPMIVIIMTVIISLFTIWYVPTTAQLTLTALEVDMNQTEFYGKVTSPINQSEKMIQFTFQPSDYKQKFQVVQFLRDQDVIKEQMIKMNNGSLCHISGKLQLPDKPTNPSQFDYQQFLLKKGITHQLIISSPSQISCNGFSLLQPLDQIRQQLMQVISIKLQPDTSQWVKALVLGDSSYIDDETIQLFQRWGLSHILAISGLHVGIIVAIVYYLIIRFSLVTKEKAQWLIIFFLPVYAILAGGAPSVWRASLMVICAIIIHKTKWKFNYTDIISIIYILFIIFDPLIIYHIGFQLSFLVTFGIILSRGWITQTNLKLLQLLQISFISQMIIIPLQINYFHIFQPFSIILNVMIVPYFSLIVIPLMFCLQICIFFLPTFIIHFIEKLFMLTHQIMLMLISFIDQHLQYPFVVGHFSIYLALIYYGLLLLMMIAFERMHKKRVMQMAILICIFLIGLKARPYLSNEGVVTMLDIGQGDAFVIELPYRKGVLMIDAGASVQFDQQNISQKAYEQVIKPYLLSRGIQKIDSIFVSHEHVDHYGSVSFIIKEFIVKNIVLSNFYDLDSVLAEKWTQQGANIERIQMGEVIKKNGQSFYTLSPQVDFHDVNENSLILYTSIGGLTWLFTGDAGNRAENELLLNWDSFQVDVLKVGHHGSNTSTDLSFVRSINPTYSLISVGKNNHYNHPNSDVIETLEGENISIYRTDIHGAVRYHFRKNNGSFIHYLQ